MRSPIDVRRLVGVREARNAKGLSLFARALLARHRMTGATADAEEARDLLDWLVAHPSPYTGPAATCPALAWGYPYPWQDVGFFAPRDFPNRVVTSFVGQALLDGYETSGDAAVPRGRVRRCVEFLLDAPKTLFEDERHRCVSYVPDPRSTWIVMDVSVLSGALAARLGGADRRRRLIEEGGRLVRYVVSKQTAEGAWFYSEPPSASHITHDNYHTGFILDAIHVYTAGAGTDEFEAAYDRGSTSTARPVRAGRCGPVHERPALPGRHPRLRAGVITFSLQQQRRRRRRRHGGAGPGLDPRRTCGTRRAAGSTTRSAAAIPHEDPRAALVPGLDVLGAGA